MESKRVNDKLVCFNGDHPFLNSTNQKSNPTAGFFGLSEVKFRIRTRDGFRVIPAVFGFLQDKVQHVLKFFAPDGIGVQR